MNWVLIALISGMLMTSKHDTEEACLGRKAIIEKDFKTVIAVKCIDMAISLSTLSNPNGYIYLNPNTGLYK